jgi:hypothetical protein
MGVALLLLAIIDEGQRACAQACVVDDERLVPERSREHRF